MKFVKLIRPLFLVALGLHGLALFVPIGPQETAVIEDLDLAELEPATRNDPSANQSTGSLPVPDLNVGAAPSAAGKPNAKPNANPGAPTAVATPTAVTRRAVPATVAVRPSAPVTRQPVSSTNPSAVQSTSTLSTPQSSSPRSGNTGSGNTGSGNRTTNSSTESTTDNENSGGSFLSSVNLPTSNSTETESGANNRASTTEGVVTVVALLADITPDLPATLRETMVSLEKSLTYSPENTDDASAQKNRSDWKSRIQRQANIGAINSLESTESTALTQVNYPIESSQQTSELMQGRNINLCLNEPQPGKAEVGVLFDASGNVVDQPELLRSTGYSAVDEEIKAIAATQENFPSDRNSKAYRFEVEVNYDEKACVALSDLKDSAE